MERVQWDVMSRAEKGGESVGMGCARLLLPHCDALLRVKSYSCTLLRGGLMLRGARDTPNARRLVRKSQGLVSHHMRCIALAGVYLRLQVYRIWIYGVSGVDVIVYFAPSSESRSFASEVTL